mmetsp:Transcript_158438/g.384816  ORF Transcript_158438/g.384816 Transcript_158438/m.384816 type:complete len:201 (+) Transcript_158438:306-908(+)
MTRAPRMRPGPLTSAFRGKWLMPALLKSATASLSACSRGSSFGSLLECAILAKAWPPEPPAALCWSIISMGDLLRFRRLTSCIRVGERFGEKPMDVLAGEEAIVSGGEVGPISRCCRCCIDAGRTDRSASIAGALAGALESSLRTPPVGAVRTGCLSASSMESMPVMLNLPALKTPTLGAPRTGCLSTSSSAPTGLNLPA